MRVGDNPSISADFNNNASTMTLDEQITNELNVPVKEHDHAAANARRDAVREIFTNLTSDEAKELYNRLQKYNHNDPLNDKFYGTFSSETIDSLKKSLKARFEPQNGLPQEPLPGWRAFLTSEMFDSLKGDQQQARDLFAHIQQNGDLKQMMANFNDEPVNFQNDFIGLGKNELQAIKQTFEELTAEAPQGSHLQDIYFESARSAAAWSD